MKIVDEKKSLGEISNLNRQKKEFAVFDAKQKDIDVIKEQISETKKGFENPESKALSNEYDIKQAELNALKAEQDAGYKSRDAHKEAFFAAKAKQSSIYQELKQIQDEYYKAKRAADQREREAKRQHFARKKAENEARDLERRRRAMEDELEAAKAPAYLDHIQACNSLIRILDPSSTLSGKASAAISQLAATAQRIVDDSGITGTRLPSKKDDDQDSYFVGGGGKKNRKGKKGRAATAAGDEASSTTSKPVDVGLFYTPGVSEQFEMIGVRPPSSGDDQPRVLEEVKQKKNYYEENQDTKTAEVSGNAGRRGEHIQRLTVPIPTERSRGTAEIRKAGRRREERSRKDKWPQRDCEEIHFFATEDRDGRSIRRCLEILGWHKYWWSRTRHGNESISREWNERLAHRLV